jgi:hypothetical protein
MKKRLLIITFATLTLMPVCTNATSIDFYADDRIGNGDNFDFVNIWNNATIEMTGGIVKYRIDTYNTSTLNISGGDVPYIDLHDASIVNLSGGLHIASDGLQHCWIYPSTGTVNIYGRDLAWIINSQNVHGYWSDGSEFLITFARIANATINLHEIPEPATALLLCIGVTLLRKLH